MLRLEDPTVELPKRIQWDPQSPSSRLEACQQLEKLLAQGFTVVAREAGEILVHPPVRQPDQLLIRVLDDNGDSRITWDRKSLAQCSEARKKFEDYLGKGYRAYVVRSDGSKGSRVETFDALLEEIIVAPGQAGDRGLGEFRPQKEAVLVPPTHPG